MLVPRDENGWRVPKEGTKSRAIYDRLKAGASDGDLRKEFGKTVGGYVASIVSEVKSLRRLREPPVPPRTPGVSDFQQEFRETRRTHGSRRIPLPKVGDIVGVYGHQIDSCGRVEEIDPETGIARVDWDLSIRIFSQPPLLPERCYVHDLSPAYPHNVDKSKFAREAR